MGADAAGLSVQVGAHYPGKSAKPSVKGRTTGIERSREGKAEVSRGHTSRRECTDEGPNLRETGDQISGVWNRCLERGPEAGSIGRNPRGKAGRSTRPRQRGQRPDDRRNRRIRNRTSGGVGGRGRQLPLLPDSGGRVRRESHGAAAGRPYPRIPPRRLQKGILLPGKSSLGISAHKPKLRHLRWLCKSLTTFAGFREG